MMKEFDESQATNEYLISELILARQTNEVLTEDNRRLETLVIKQSRLKQDSSV
jgi:hypothetical protein